MTAMSKTTPIIFAKGSSCSAYEGNVIDKKFTLNLNAGQTLLINPDMGIVESIDRMIVQNPKGQILQSLGFSEWKNKVKGQHNIKIIPKSGNSFVSVNICAY